MVLNILCTVMIGPSTILLVTVAALLPYGSYESVSKKPN